MSERGGLGRSGLGRLLAYSLAAAVVAVVVSKLRPKKAAPAVEPAGLGDTDPGGAVLDTAARVRARALPLAKRRRGSEASDDGSPEPEAEPASTTAASEERTEEPSDPDQVDSLTDSLALTMPEVDPSVSQAAVQTTEIDPLAWPDPPAPPPVVPADTVLSTLVHDGSAVDQSAQDPNAGIEAAASVTAPIGSGQFPSRPVAGQQGGDAALNDGGHLDDLDHLDGFHRPDGDQDTILDHNRDHTADGSQGPDNREATAGGPFYGWYLVAAVFVILCITSGVGFYNASVILAAAIRELDASVGAVSGATGLFFAIGGLTGFAFSKRMESVDIRLFFVAGGIVGAAALMGLRWVTNVPGLYVFFGFFGIAFGLAGLVPATTLVTRWFDRRRSVALSIASTGLSLGGIIVTPFSDWLIDQRTLSGAAPYLAAIWLIGVIPIALLVVRSHPADKGLRPDGDPVPQLDRVDTEEPPTEVAEGFEEAVPGLSFARARTTRFFMALCLAYAVIFFGQVGGIAQLFNMILERTDAPTARTALATVAGSSVVFRLLGGAAVLRVPTQSFSAALAVLQAVALALLAVTNSSTGLILSAAFFGCSIGNLLMLQPLLLAEAFGVANYGRIYSFNQLFGTAGVAGGPFALGLIRDAADYRAAFLAAAIASFIGCLAIIAAGSTSRVTALWQ